MKKINPDNNVFLSDEYQKDKYMFCLISLNLSNPNLELYSDEDNYVICRGSKNWPAWIWTKDNFDLSKIDEIEELIRMYLTENDKDKFTCKKELYDLLVSRGFDKLNSDDYFEMGFLICNNTTKPKNCDGILSNPIEVDREILERYWFDDNREMNGVDEISFEQAKKDVDMFIKSDKFYVLRNADGKIVSMANYSLIDNQAKLSHVYTPVDERKKDMQPILFI